MYAEAIRDTLVNSLSQFVSDDSGTNLGVGFSGWDSALKYSRANNLDYFGSVFAATGDEDEPKAFGYGMWRWGHYVRMHVKFEVDASPTPDEKANSLADDFMDAMLNSSNVFSISSSGHVKVAAANYLGQPENVENVTYLTIEFLVVVTEQLSRG